MVVVGPVTVPQDDVTFVDTGSLEITIPSVLSVGLHGLSVTTPVDKDLDGDRRGSSTRYGTSPGRSDGMIGWNSVRCSSLLSLSSAQWLWAPCFSFDLRELVTTSAKYADCSKPRQRVRKTFPGCCPTIPRRENVLGDGQGASGAPFAERLSMKAAVSTLQPAARCRTRRPGRPPASLGCVQKTATSSTCPTIPDRFPRIDVSGWVEGRLLASRTSRRSRGRRHRKTGLGSPHTPRANSVLMRVFPPDEFGGPVPLFEFLILLKGRRERSRGFHCSTLPPCVAAGSGLAGRPAALALRWNR